MEIRIRWPEKAEPAGRRARMPPVTSRSRNVLTSAPVGVDVAVSAPVPVAAPFPRRTVREALSEGLRRRHSSVPGDGDGNGEDTGAPEEQRRGRPRSAQADEAIF